MKTQATAKLRNLRVAPRKVRLVADLIRGREINDAMIQLEFCSKQAAKPVLKLLQSAVANALNNHSITEETLSIKSIQVDGGPTMHRFMPRAMGRAFRIRKRTSHITLVLEGEAKEAAKPEKAKRTKKEKVEETSNTAEEAAKE